MLMEQRKAAASAAPISFSIDDLLRSGTTIPDSKTEHHSKAAASVAHPSDAVDVPRSHKFSDIASSSSPAISAKKEATASLERKNCLMNGIPSLHFDEKTILSSPADALPLWLNCAAATLPFEQSYFMAQRSGKLDWQYD